MHPKQTNLVTPMLACGTILLASVIASGCESAPQYTDTSTVNDSDTSAMVDDDELSPSLDGEKRTTVTCSALPFDAQAFSMRVETPGSARSTYSSYSGTEQACPIPPCVIEPSIEVVGVGFTVRFAIDHASVGKLDKPILKVTGVPRGHGMQSVTSVIDTPLQFDWNEAGDALTVKVTETDLEKISSAELSWVSEKYNPHVEMLSGWKADSHGPRNREIMGKTTTSTKPQRASPGKNAPPTQELLPSVCCEWDCHCFGGKQSCVCTWSLPAGPDWPCP